MTLEPNVEIVEVGPRDGLQSLARVVPTSVKVTLITRLVAAGLRRVEVASFVNPRLVPQMADADALLRALPRGVASYIGLVLNTRGAERALAAGVDELSCVCAATDTFGLTNQGADRASSLAVACATIGKARAQGRLAHATIAVAFGCPYEGSVPHARVLDTARALRDAGASEVVLADTIGVAAPPEVARLCGELRSVLGDTPLRVHFHDTRGAGIANVWAAYGAGVRRFDGSVAGLGGCPFAPGASGNVATEHVVYAFTRGARGHTGIDLAALVDTARWLRQHIEGAPTLAQEEWR
jgi:hydroxymethylglutaryl-CoA lyase